MSVKLTVGQNLNVTAQKVKDEAGNSSSLCLTKNGNVGIGKTDPAHKLDVNGTIRLRSSNLGEGLYFAKGYSLGDGSQRFRLQRNFNPGLVFRIFEVVLSDPDEKGEFFFDNVDVYPDDDNAQRLGTEDNRWSELHAAKGLFTEGLNLANLTTPPPGVSTVDLVIDPKTGTIYRKN